MSHDKTGKVRRADLSKPYGQNESDANLKGNGQPTTVVFSKLFIYLAPRVLAAACGIVILTCVMNLQLQHVESFFKLWHVESLDVACELLEVAACGI